MDYFEQLKNQLLLFGEIKVEGLNREEMKIFKEDLKKSKIKYEVIFSSSMIKLI
jgi:hypothetical protein